MEESLRNIRELSMQMRTVIPALATVKFCGEDQVEIRGEIAWQQPHSALARLSL